MCRNCQVLIIYYTHQLQKLEDWFTSPNFTSTFRPRYRNITFYIANKEYLEQQLRYWTWYQQWHP